MTFLAPLPAPAPSPPFPAPSPPNHSRPKVLHHPPARREWFGGEGWGEGVSKRSYEFVRPRTFRCPLSPALFAGESVDHGQAQSANNAGEREPEAARRRGRPRRGISLLEMLLALAILAGAFGALSGIVSIGSSAAVESRNRSMAQLLCEQQMSRLILSGAQPTGMAPTPLETPDPSETFYGSVEVQPAPLQGMLMVRVAVSTRPDAVTPDAALVRWMIDPIIAMQMQQAEWDAKAMAAAAAEDAAMAADAAADAGGT